MKKIQNLFLVLIFFSVISYSEHALYAFKNKIVVSIQYGAYPNFQISKIGSSLKYVKDGLVLFIIFMSIIDLILRTNKNKKENKMNILLFLSIILLVLSEGIMQLALRGEFSYLMVIAGCRGVMYLCAVIIVATKYFTYDFYKKIYKLINILLVFEEVVLLLQAYQLIKYYGIVYLAKIRLCGTFPFCANLSYFLMAVSINEMVKSFIIDENLKSGKIRSVLKMLNISVMIYLTGSRSALIVSMFILLICTYILITRGIKNKRIYMNILAILCSLIMAPTMISVVESMAKRGSILEANKESGRIKVILDYVKDEKSSDVFFGKGIGYGTNTAVIFKDTESYEGEVATMDGTINTMITQFGIVTTAVILFLITMGLIYYFKFGPKIDFMINFAIIFTFILLCFTANIFEEYAFLLLSFSAVFSIRFKDVNNVSNIDVSKK